MAKHLIVIYGPPLAGKTTVAWALARSFEEKAVVVSVDALLGGSIAVPDAEAQAELAMVHTQVRLLVATYLKNGYQVVVEGPFLFERGGVLRSFEAEVDQLVALMRHLTEAALIVRLGASEAVLAERARAAGREEELATALRTAPAYKERYGRRFRAFDTGVTAVDAIVGELRAALAEAG